jgi:hypothetical protein
MGVGACALAALLGPVSSRGAGFARPDESITNGSAHHRPKARRVISLFQSGGPSQLDLFDPKPSLFRYAGADMRTMTDLGMRLTGMTRDQGYFPVVPSAFEFSPSGQSGIEISSLLPATAEIVDEICLLRAVRTHAINHDPAITFLMTGSERPGRPSAGAWVSYALGCGNDNLPAFVVLSSHGTGRTDCQPLYERLWDSGFLPARHRGTGFLPDGDPFLYLENPPGFDQSNRRFMLDMAARINGRQYHFQGDPRILDRMRNMEMAARMQTAVPELTDLRDEPASVLRRYGPDVSQRGSYAWNCLMARRLAERDVRFIQLFHTGWDQHFHLPEQLPRQCADTDRPTAALIDDLRIRGLLDDTLVIWGGEFGRTAYGQGQYRHDDFGRDHHAGCFSMWMAGGGIRGGQVHGATDELGQRAVSGAVDVHDIHATMLQLLGLDHRQLKWSDDGRDFRLTDTGGRVVHPILL